MKSCELWGRGHFSFLFVVSAGSQGRGQVRLFSIPVSTCQILMCQEMHASATEWAALLIPGSWLLGQLWVTVLQSSRCQEVAVVTAYGFQCLEFSVTKGFKRDNLPGGLVLSSSQICFWSPLLEPAPSAPPWFCIHLIPYIKSLLA